MTTLTRFMLLAGLATALATPCVASTQGDRQVSAAQKKRGATVPKYKKKSRAAKSVGEDYIVLRRGACYGKCPQYSVRISGAVVHFLGEQHVAVMGSAEAQVDVAALQVLREKLLAPELLRLQNIYGLGQPGCGMVTTDMPSSHVAWRLGGLNHQLDIYHGCAGAPMALQELPGLIDAAAGTARWVSDGLDR